MVKTHKGDWASVEATDGSSLLRLEILRLAMVKPHTPSGKGPPQGKDGRRARGPKVGARVVTGAVGRLAGQKPRRGAKTGGTPGDKRSTRKTDEERLPAAAVNNIPSDVADGQWGQDSREDGIEVVQA